MRGTIYRRIPGTVSSLSINLWVLHKHKLIHIFPLVEKRNTETVHPDKVAIILLKSQIPCAE